MKRWRRWRGKWRQAVRGWRRRLWETDVGRLRGLSAADAAELRGARMPTVEAVLDRIAADGFDATVQGLAVSPRRLRVALTRYALREARGRTRPPLLRGLRFLGVNWMEGMLAAFAAALIALGVRAAGRPEGDVVPRHDLPAFHVIGPGDVDQHRGPAAFGTYETAKAVVGRFPLRAAAAGKPLHRDSLSAVRIQPPDVLRGRRIVSLPIPVHALPLAVQGARVELLLSPRDAGDGPGSVLSDVIVLQAREGGAQASLVVAVRAADLPALARSLASAEVFVLQQVTPPTPPE